MTFVTYSFFHFYSSLRVSYNSVFSFLMLFHPCSCNSSQIHSPSLSIQLRVFYYFKPNKTNLCCAHTFMCGFPLESCHLTRGYIVGENCLFLSQWLAIVNGPMARGEPNCPLHCWDLIWLGLVQILCMLSQPLCFDVHLLCYTHNSRLCLFGIYTF